jgi:hypothetical protein
MFAGQTVTVIVNDIAGATGPITGPLYEIRPEFEAATGATLKIVDKPLDEHFAHLITDLTTGAGQYDASIAGAWWLGDLVTQDLIRPYDDFYNDPRFPRWDIEDVQPAPAPCWSTTATNIWSPMTRRPGDVLSAGFADQRPASGPPLPPSTAIRWMSPNLGAISGRGRIF